MSAPGLEARALEALDAALDAPDADRDAHLADLETSDPALARRVRALLEADDRAGAALPTRPASPARAEPPQPPPERVGVYRLAGLLGEGGMGSVYRGVRDDGLFEQVVAVKLVRPGLFAASALAQFAVERRVLARLRHPNIAQLFDGGADPQGRAWFAMELVEGAALVEHVRARGLSLRQAVELVIPVCAAVQHAHGALVVHADIKPSNILVDGEGRPKLLDFGIARNLGEAEEAGAGHGLTAAYASPARLAGEPPTTTDDVYALGALLWELAQGRPPPGAPPPPCGPATPAELAAVIAKATAAEASSRYDSAGALADDLRRWLDDRPVRARPDGAARSARLLLRRRPRATAAAGLALAGLLVALAVITGLYQRSEGERREADRRFAQARGMAHYMLFDLFDRLNDAPGTLPVRRELADRARGYLDDLAGAPRAPVDVRAEAAVGYMQLAGVQSMFSAGQLGERGRGGAPLDRAAALLDAAPAGARADPRWVRASGRLKLFQGFAADDQGGAAGRAEALLRGAVADLGAAARAMPRDAETAVDLLQARLTLAATLSGAQRYPEAIAEARAAGDEARARAAVLAAHPKTPLLLARSHKLVGDALYYSERKPEAAREFAAALDILLREDALRPRRSRTLMEILDAEWNLGGTIADLDRRPEALALYDRALAAGRARQAIEPEHDGLRRMVSLLELERAALLAAMGRTREALEAAEANLAARRAFSDAHPGDPVAYRGYLVGLRQTAQVEVAAGRRAAACDLFRRGVGGFAAFQQAYSVSAQTLAVELGAMREALKRCPAA